jgi:hypothetical protein
MTIAVKLTETTLVTIGDVATIQLAPNGKSPLNPLGVDL